MDFHFACCTCNLPKHPLGVGCQLLTAGPKEENIAPLQARQVLGEKGH